MHIWDLTGGDARSRRELFDALVEWLDSRDFMVSAVIHRPSVNGCCDREEVCVAECGRWARLYELPPGVVVDDALLAQLDECDIVITNDVHFSREHMVELVDNPPIGGKLAYRNDPSVSAIVCNCAPEAAIPAFRYGDVDALGCFITQSSGLVLPGHCLALSMQA